MKRGGAQLEFHVNEVPKTPLLPMFLPLGKLEAKSVPENIPNHRSGWAVTRWVGEQSLKHVEKTCVELEFGTGGLPLSST